MDGIHLIAEERIRAQMRERIDRLHASYRDAHAAIARAKETARRWERHFGPLDRLAARKAEETPSANSPV